MPQLPLWLPVPFDTFMFGTIRKHSQALWIPIIIVIIISFVVYFTPDFDPFGSRGGPGITADEVALAQAKQYVLLEQALNASQQFRGFLPPQFNPDFFARQMRPHNLMGNDPLGQAQFGEMDDYPGLDYRGQLRLLRLNKAAQLGLVVGYDTVIARIESMFVDEKGAFSAERFEASLMPFQQNGFLSKGETGKEQFREFIRQSILLGQLDRLMTQSAGFIPDHSTAHSLADQNREFTSQAVFFPDAQIRTNVTKEIDANATPVLDYYNGIKKRYAVAPKKRYGYVKISNDFYTEQVEAKFKNDQSISFATLVTNRIQRHIDNNATPAIFTDANGTKLPAGPQLNDAARDDVRATYQVQLDKDKLALSKVEADAFAKKLFDDVDENQWIISRLQMLSTNHTGQPLVYMETAHPPRPLDEQLGRDLPDSVTDRIASSLNGAPGGTLHTQLIEVSNEGYYVIGYVGPIAGRDRTFGELTDAQKEEVRKEYLDREVADRVKTEADDYRKTVDEFMKEGKTFAAIATETNGTYPTVALPPMKLNSTNEVAELEGYALINQVQQALYGYDAKATNWISEFERAENEKSGGFIIHVSNVDPGPPPSPGEVKLHAERERRGARNFVSSFTLDRFGMVPPWLEAEAKVLDAELALNRFLTELRGIENEYVAAQGELKELDTTISRINTGTLKLPDTLTMGELINDREKAVVRMITLRSNNVHRLPAVLRSAQTNYVNLTGNSEKFNNSINSALKKSRELEQKLKEAEQAANKKNK